MHVVDTRQFLVKGSMLNCIDCELVVYLKKKLVLADNIILME